MKNLIVFTACFILTCCKLDAQELSLKSTVQVHATTIDQYWNIQETDTLALKIVSNIFYTNGYYLETGTSFVAVPLAEELSQALGLYYSPDEDVVSIIFSIEKGPILNRMPKLLSCVIQKQTRIKMTGHPRRGEPIPAN